MAEEAEKVTLKQTRSTFAFKGRITNFDETKPIEGKTSKGNPMRTLIFNIETAEGHIHKMQLRAYQRDKVYFSKFNKDNKDKKSDIQEVKWEDRFTLDKEYLPMDRVTYHKGKDDKGKEVSVTALTFDAIPDIAQEFKVGDIVRVVGNIEIKEFEGRDGNMSNYVTLIPTRIFHSSDLDFESEKFQECANFTSQFLIESAEKTGTKELTVTGISIGNRVIGRQDYIFRDKAYDAYEAFIRDEANHKYTAIIANGILVNATEAEDKKEEYITTRTGKKIPKISRTTVKSFVREFVVSEVVSEDGFIDYDTYTEDNVQEFINDCIRARQEFGKSTTDETVKEEDFIF